MALDITKVFSRIENLLYGYGINTSVKTVTLSSTSAKPWVEFSLALILSIFYSKK